MKKKIPIYFKHLRKALVQVMAAVGYISLTWFLWNFAIQHLHWTQTEERTAVSNADEDLLAIRLQELVRGAHESLGLDYAVGFISDDRTLLLEARGWASDNVPLSTRTPMLIGSISKQFIAATLVKLSETRSLHLEASVCSVIQELCGSQVGEVSLIHLLNHTSGLPRDEEQGLSDYLLSLQEAFSGTERSRETLIERIRSVRLLSPPGEKYLYSNLGYLLLSLIAERISGVPLGKILQETLWGPAGLHQTFLATDSSASSYATLYRRYPAPWSGRPLRDTWIFPLPGMNMNVTNLSGAGGIASSAEDLLAWGDIANRRLVLNQQNWEKIETPYLEEYGWGWVIEEHRLSRDRSVWHNGQWAGNYAILYRWPERKQVVVFITNNRIETTSAHQEFKKSLSRLLAGQPYRILKPSSLPIRFSY